MKHICLFLFIALLAACRDDHAIDLQPDSGNHIRFSAMQIGQTSRYVRFAGEDYGDPNNFNFSYLADTLVLRIIGAEASGYLVEEKLTPGSASLNGAGNLPNADTTYVNYWKIEHDTLFMHATDGSPWIWSHFANGGFILPLTAFTAPIVEIQGWKTTHSYTESYWTGVDPAYSLFGNLYANLNVLTDNRPMATDGPGALYVYSRQNGVVKTATYSWWTSQGSGWDLLPDF